MAKLAESDDGEEEAQAALPGTEPDRARRPGPGGKKPGAPFLDEEDGSSFGDQRPALEDGSKTPGFPGA